MHGKMREGERGRKNSRRHSHTCPDHIRLHWAAEACTIESQILASDSAACVKELLAAGADPDAKGQHGQSVLTLARS